MPSAMNISVESILEESPLLLVLIACPLCCEEKPRSDICRLSRCGHESCTECTVKWIEKTESSGQTSHPGCPFCRLEMTPEETRSILGRPFRPACGTTAAAVQAAELDDLTLQWLTSRCQACPSCGAYIEKAEDSCDMMECLCGFRFCYKCGAQGAQCSCTPTFHRFWDNILNKQSSISAPPPAARDEQTGCVDLKNHIFQRKQEERSRRIRMERMELREQEAYERLEDVNFSAVWLFRSSREASLRVLGQVLRGRRIRWVRGKKMVDQDLEQSEMQADTGKWLFSTKDAGSQVIQSLYSCQAMKRRGRRKNARINASRPLTGVDAAFASGKWLYYRQDNAGTLRQIVQFCWHQQNETAAHFDRWFLRDEYAWCDCGECDECEDAEQEEEDNAARTRVFFLDDEEAKAQELDEISRHGLNA